jgi:hypothetical protein
MKPKEKANELFNKMHIEVDTIYVMSKSQAKQCALIAVDEIINNSLEYMGCDLKDGEIIYWQEVKQEIEKL